MQHKIILLIGMLLLFLGCSEKEYASMYYERFNPFDIHQNTAAKSNYEMVKNGKNPMKRPSYVEYRQK